MIVFVNGESQELAEEIPVEKLLTDLGYEQSFVAVAVNSECVGRSQYATTLVRAGDKLEILAPMAGG